MSFTTIRNIATSSLMATSVQTALASSNIANADVDGYSRKVATQSSTVTGGEGSGTTITAITSKVNKFLVQAVTKALSDVGVTSVADTYADRLQSLFGQTIGGGSDSKSGTSLANLLASLETAVSDLAATPEGESLQASVVDKFSWIATQLRDVSRGIQDLRAEADSEINTAVDAVNTTLNDIADLNREIGLAAARGDSTADLEDKRNTALQALSKKMDVTYFVNSAGAMQIYTTTGQTLLTSKVHEISYVALGAVTATTDANDFNDIELDGVDITASFKSGEISGLISQRNDVLQAAQKELDEFAGKFIDAVNAVHNTGTSLPPPSTLTSTSSFASGDTIGSSTGLVRVACVKADGTLASSADIDLSGCSTVADVITAINGISGLSASINAAGKLEVKATATGTGVAINERDSNVAGTGQGFSDYFGLNDLLIGTGASDINVRSDLKAQPGTLSNSTLSITTATAGAKVLTSGDATVAKTLYDTLTGSTTFAAAGRLGTTSTSFASYAADVVADVAAVSSNASSAATTAKNVQTNLSDSLAGQSGVNVDEETASLSELEKLYATASQIIATLNAMFDALLTAAKSA